MYRCLIQAKDYLEWVERANGATCETENLKIKWEHGSGPSTNSTIQTEDRFDEAH